MPRGVARCRRTGSANQSGFKQRHWCGWELGGNRNQSWFPAWPAMARKLTTCRVPWALPNQTLPPAADVIKNHPWGKHPMASVRFFVLPHVMSEERFVQNLQTAAAQPSLPNPRRIGIQIHWREGKVEIIKIQHHPVSMKTVDHSISLKPAGRPARTGPLVLSAQAPMFFTPRPGRRTN
jgi:hypothetical protein